MAADVKEIKNTLHELAMFIQKQQVVLPSDIYECNFNPWPETEASQHTLHSPRESTPLLQPNLHDTLPENLTDPFFTASVLIEAQRQSCSWNNFVANLVRKVFSAEETKISNVRGVLGKTRLDPRKIDQIKVVVFQIYPCGTGEKPQSIWRACCKAIDESCRRLNRNK